MGFIGNQDEIKEITPHQVGRLFECSVTKELDCAKGDDAKILDTNSYNFHLYPKDAMKMKKLQKKYKQQEMT